MSFKELNLIPELNKVLLEKNYFNPTQIQSKAIPFILDKKDILAISQTGSGKTAAFILPILNMLEINKTSQVLILAPTRELVVQIQREIIDLSNYLKIRSVAITGGVKQELQTEILEKGVDIIIGTPGRVFDLVEQEKLNIKEIKYFVADEFDVILDMGFSRDVDKILKRLPKQKQSLLFSATNNERVEEFTNRLLKNPKTIVIESESNLASKMVQEVYYVAKESKYKLIRHILENKELKSVLIFTNSKLQADKLVRNFTKYNIKSIALHSGKSQVHRTKALKKFQSDEIKILIATDLASRGLHIDNVTHVINYELPNKPNTYIHRIGRTARAGAKGVAYSLCSGEEREYMRNIESLIGKELNAKKHDFYSKVAKNAVGEKAKPRYSKQYSGFTKKVKKKDKPKKSGRQY